MGKLRIQTEDGQTSSGWANQEDATTRKRPPWAAGSTVRGGVPKVHPKGAGPGRGFPARDGPPEGRTAQWGLKPCSRFSCYFFQKKKKSQKTFRIRGSPIRKWLFPNRTPSLSLSLSLSDFCLQSHSSSSPSETPLRAEFSSPFTKGRKQSNTADPSQGPHPLGLGVRAWEVNLHKTKWPR